MHLKVKHINSVLNQMHSYDAFHSQDDGGVDDHEATFNAQIESIKSQLFSNYRAAEGSLHY
jgi:hypothetical protein